MVGERAAQSTAMAAEGSMEAGRRDGVGGGEVTMTRGMLRMAVTAGAAVLGSLHSCSKVATHKRPAGRLYQAPRNTVVARWPF